MRALLSTHSTNMALKQFKDGLALSVCETGIATVRMCNGENRFRLSFVQAWHKVLDEVKK